MAVARIEGPRLERLMNRERDRFRETHPQSAGMAARARGGLLGGVPMNWMTRWPGGFPVFAERAAGARVTDIDGHEYVDFCLGDTGAMTGHAPAAAQQVIAAQAARGLTMMLPSADAVRVAEEMGRRFGLPFWQFALTATDANRFAIRIARALTGRPYILVFNGCYHGTVDETFATRTGEIVGPRRGNLGPPVNPAVTTKVVEFNDPDQLADALAPEDVACVLAEPVMTNVGIIHPHPGYHQALREITRRHGTLLILDETHTISAGIGGYTREAGLEPDMVTVGKPIGSGVPAAAYGVSAEIADGIGAMLSGDDADTIGIGGTLAGNALSLAAMRVTLEEVLTEGAYRRMLALAGDFERGVEEAIGAAGLPWHVTRVGARVEYLFQPTRPKNGGEALAAAERTRALDAFMHLYLLNRNILMTPFHNMALMSPATRPDDVARHTRVFREAIAELTAG